MIKTDMLRSVIVVLLLIHLTLSWNPDAGIIRSLTKANGVTVSATSGNSSANRVLDDNDNTNWVSGYCIPNAYFSRKDVNTLFGLCSKGKCKSLDQQPNDISFATDGSVYTVAHVHATAGYAKFSLNVTPAQTFQVLTVNGIFHDANATLSVIDDRGARHGINVFGPTDSYKDVQIFSVNVTVSVIEIDSHSDFAIKEIAAIGQQGCVEQITVDLGSVKPVGTIRTRHWTGTNAANSLILKMSVDGVSWTTEATLDPSAIRPITTSIAETYVRFIALEYQVRLEKYKKVYCYEIDAWDKHGRWGSPIRILPQTKTVRDILGVNGIWGWGHSTYSNSLPAGQGPTLYNSIASHARNYHNLNWDVRDPDNDPGFFNMSNGHGTNAKWWLNWDTEYKAWKNAGFFIDTSIQFTNKTFPQNMWNTPESSAFRYGREFANHFGSENGNGLVDAVEIGNEPWDYESQFYAIVLKGMTAGIRSSDRRIIVLPAAFQADDSHDTGNYIGTRVLPEVADFIDVINSHSYSFVNTPNGLRTGTFPEHSESTFNSIKAIARWRDVNTPLKPIWITEWGWDSDGGGESCEFTECVSEQAQAVYGVRGLMVLVRSNVEKATWFFYANTDCNTLFCRSGLTTSKSRNFSKKAVFLVFQDLLSHIGNKYFMGVLQENETGYIYVFGASAGKVSDNRETLLTKATHLIAWLPLDINDQQINNVSLHLPADIHVGTALLFTGNSNGQQTESLQYPPISDQRITLRLSTFPILIELVHGHGNVIVGK